MDKISSYITSLDIRRFVGDLKLMILKLLSMTDILCISCEIPPKGNTTGSDWWLVNIGSRNDLVPSGNKS